MCICTTWVMDRSNMLRVTDATNMAAMQMGGPCAWPYTDNGRHSRHTLHKLQTAWFIESAISCSLPHSAVSTP